MNDLRDRLLLEDGINPNDVPEQELARFRTLLAEEQKRAHRLSWMVQVPLWGGSLLLLCVCIGEDLWDRLGIPFLAASSLAVVAMWLAFLGPTRRLIRRLEQSRSRIRWLKGRLPEHANTGPSGIPLVARQGQRRLVFWPGVLLVVVIAALIAVVGANAIWLLLTGRFSGFATAWQIVLGVFFVAAMVRRGLAGPLRDLRELGHPNRLLWIAVPEVLTFRVPRRVQIASVTCLLTLLPIAAILSFFQGGTVYARAFDSLRQARSIHAVGYGFQDGHPIKQSEIWHVRGVGTRIQRQHNEQTIDMYDDGKDRYEYVEGNDYAVKRPGRGELLPRELVEPLRYLQDARRDESQDRTINGTLCLCYARGDSNHQSLIWIDEAMRFRRYEEYRQAEGQRQQVELIEIGYDESFEFETPARTFERRGIRIVEPAQILDTRYGLENAIASTEVLGLTFAIHELHKCGDYLFIACSVRPTAQSLEDLRKAGHDGTPLDHIGLGGLDLSSWWQRKADGSLEEHSYAITGLGHLSHKGVDFRWYAMLARGRWPGQDERLEVCAHVRTDGRLEELRRHNGLDWHGQFRPLVTVNIPPAQSDLVYLARDLCELGHMVTAVSRSAQDLFVSEASGVTAEQFQQRLEKLLAGLRPMGELWDRVGSNLELRLVDEQGAPVAGARIESRVDRALPVSDDRGQLSIPGEQLFRRDASQDSRQVVYAIHRDRQLVAWRAVGGDDFSSPLQIVMVPACRVHAALGWPEEKKAENMTVQANVSTTIRRADSPNGIIVDVLRWTLQDPSIEIWLSPGEYELHCYTTHEGANLSSNLRFAVRANTRTVNLGTVELRADR
ncbi:MAG: hypothetical protein KBE65_02945 [Phycisphaerae bacterium]|nr:hypothetical protein [Phycisphaerae bacterium]